MRQHARLPDERASRSRATTSGRSTPARSSLACRSSPPFPASTPLMPSRSGHLGWLNAAAASMEPTLRPGRIFPRRCHLLSQPPAEPRRGRGLRAPQATRPPLHQAHRRGGGRPHRHQGRPRHRQRHGGRGALCRRRRSGGAASPTCRRSGVPPDTCSCSATIAPTAWTVATRSRTAPVPVSNLIGRVTDIAFSHDLTRMGRWIGTPSNL